MSIRPLQNQLKSNHFSTMARITKTQQRPPAEIQQPLQFFVAPQAPLLWNNSAPVSFLAGVITTAVNTMSLSRGMSLRGHLDFILERSPVYMEVLLSRVLSMYGPYLIKLALTTPANLLKVGKFALFSMTSYPNNVSDIIFCLLLALC